MQDAIYPQRERDLDSKLSKRKFALAAGIAGTFALGALISAQFGQQQSEEIFNMQSSASLQCSSVIANGELKTLDQWCVSIKGTAKNPGNGNLHTEYCNGTGDQQYQYCTDGTFRNIAENTCLTNQGGSVQATGCQSDASQTWDIETQGTWTAPGTSVGQNIHTFKSQKGGCLVIDGNKSGSGDFGMGSCSSQDSHLYFNYNGQMLAQGTMTNEKTRQCVQMNLRNNMSDTSPLLVNNESCKSQDAAQLWQAYENGSIINTDSSWCLESEEKSGNGLPATYPCTGASNQQWIMYNSGVGNVYVWQNKASKKCFQFSSDGNPQLDKCNEDPQQQFAMYKPGAGAWTTPQGTWVNGNCDESSSVSMSAKQAIVYKAGVSEYVKQSVATAMTVAIEFYGVQASPQTCTAIADQFRMTLPMTPPKYFECEYYAGTSTPFTTGCIWQTLVSTTNQQNNVSLTFSSAYVGCTQTNAHPQCPPMEQCANSSCTSCVNIS